jgi:hypothetical protein
MNEAYLELKDWGVICEEVPYMSKELGHENNEG